MFVSEAQLANAVNALQSGQYSPSSYLESRRERVDEVEDDIEALVEEEDRWTRLENQLDELESAYGESERKPSLYGIPVGVKDIFNVNGLPTYAGTSLPASEFEGPESTVWKRLREAGAVPLGKTVTTEFAYFDPGPTANPHDISRTPGGSSSGSAAAVAAGLCPLALGTQTVGSVIRPAAFCGVFGFKPSYGRVPVEGVLPLSPSLDHIGLFTQDLAGVRLVAPIIYDEWKPTPEPDTRPTLGVPAESYLNQTREIGITRFERHLDILAELDYEIKRTELLSDIDQINEGHYDLMAAEAAITHREQNRHPKYDDQYAGETIELLNDGDQISASEIGDQRANRFNLRSKISTEMDRNDIDVWLSPAAPGPAPKGLDDTGDPAMNLPWTNAGVPTITLPVDKTDEGLPLGLQCSSRLNTDEELLEWVEMIADDMGVITHL